MKKFLLAAVAMAAVAPALAQSAPPVPPATVAPAPHAMHAPMKADRVHTRAEVVAKVREHFTRLDSNRDGFLTKAEADAGRAAMKERWQSQGIGHALNVKRDPNAMFDRLDANRDGAISRDEFTKGHEMRVERKLVLKDKVEGGKERRQSDNHLRMHRMGGMIGGRMFEMADVNKDGRVSLQEATDAAVRHFDMADANRDGQITPEERRQMHRQMIEKHRAAKAG